MAKGQSQGVNAITVWMIVFVALWLTSTVFLVILYTGQAEITEHNGRLLAENRRLISSAESKSIEQVKDASESGPTVVGLLEAERSRTATLATGDAANSAAEVRTKRDQLLRLMHTEGQLSNADAFVDASYHDALVRLYEIYKAEHALRQTAEGRAAELETQVTQFVEAGAEQMNNFDKQAKDTARQLEQVEAERDDYRKKRDNDVEELAREFKDGRARNDADLTKERQQRATAEKAVEDLQKRLSAQEEKLGGLRLGPEKLSTARQPDGKILTAVPGDSVVYINLGRQHALTLGMRFAVYSARTGIPEDGRAKAQIEVVSISDNSAECRIVGVAGNEVILESDLIANPVYDPNRPLSFVVLGVFDLDRDGLPDRDGAATLESLIANWGGTISADLTPLTDFVILGEAPRRPKAAGEGADQGATAPANDPVALAWTRYFDMLDSAKTLAVPRLTQDVFLNFLGYGGRNFPR